MTAGWTVANVAIGPVAVGWRRGGDGWRLNAISLPADRQQSQPDPQAECLLAALADPQVRSTQAWAMAARVLDHLTPFARSVLDALAAQVPAGRVISYGALAAMVGRPGAARAVGTVLRSNRWPLLVPCHRVVAADGRLGAFQGGSPGSAARKRALLVEEGVTVRAGRVALSALLRS
ncbi:MAG: methylated-DNA--[protein]-cysteine S-methyltransferase [Planctomycetota bacterium]